MLNEFMNSPEMILMGALVLVGVLLLFACLLLLTRRNGQDQSQLINHLISQQSQMMQQLNQQSLHNTQNMGELSERLALIAQAQERLDQMGQDMVSLQDILSNKQARGAFGETQMNDIIKQALPPSAYDFQVSLSNGTRVDALIQLPNPTGALAIDAKFPLEYWRHLTRAEDEASRKQARSQFITMMKKHLNDISEKYLIPGETSNSALLFLPSEAIYADIHSDMPEVIAHSQAVRVYITSPTTLMATMNTMRAILKDANMREQAGVILKEVGLLSQDIARLTQRTDQLKKHFDQSLEDIRQIQISAEKIGRRADHINQIDMQADPIRQEAPARRDRIGS